ncbi:MAG: transketolase [Prevotellaceae bacterium]|jgi:transketolase|nr:transketolase [Prevotellaceae bacterium]
MNSIQNLNKAADNIRILAASMVEKAKSGHPGGAMGGTDFINVLFSEFLEYDPQNPHWELRDRFFLDPGHMSPMLYSVLTCAEKFTLADLQQFRQWGSETPGHPELCVERGIENTSGPLGQGHTYAVGAAIAAKFLKARFGEIVKHKIYAYISDGGIQEEISQGAGRIAGHLGLDNLIMFYDSNDIQLSTTTAAVTSENVAQKYEAWGWKVLNINGNDVAQIRAALTKAKAETQRPTLIIGKTIMGKGARRADNSSYENDCETHGAPLGGDAYKNTVINLGGNPENPFVLFDETKEIYAKRKAELIDLMKVRKQEFDAWAKNNSELAEKFNEFFETSLTPQPPFKKGGSSEVTSKNLTNNASPEFPPLQKGGAPERRGGLNWQNIVQKPNQATRAASATVLAELAKSVENMIVSSADLSNSDKTDGFLKQTKAFAKGDFSGAFLQAGVSELTMACLCIGMTLHGGVIAACATFFVFSDYMKPAIRMAALMELPVKFIFSHDAFRVGEDGPTHEPVEQEAQIRLMEKLHNHSGKPSMLVLRPADVYETTDCYRLAMENISTPTTIILSRQNIKDLQTEKRSVERGAYIVFDEPNPDIILVASGSEVSSLQDAAVLLRNDGVKVRLVSVPSEGLFRSQSIEYQNNVLPQNIKKFGLTAGLPVNLLGLVGENGKIFGLESFGFSAPYTVLDEKLGFTAEQIYRKIIND